MKKFNLLFLLLITSVSLFAQRINSDESTGVIVASEFHITRPIREIFAENPIDETKYFKQESGDRKHRIPQKFEFSANDGPEYSNDPKTIQDKMGTEPNRAPLTNWAGQSATGFRPMDPSGAAGPNHYIQMINSTTFKVYNKVTGANMLTGSFGNLWSPATPNDGDPIVLYDKTADRWFMSQFGTSGNKIYIAISQTPDPTGAYYTYTFSSPLFPDYLKFSVWTDGYYMTSNQSTQRVFSFNRAELLAGNPSARSIYTNFSPPDGTGFFCPLPADAADGSLPPAGTPCPILSYSDNNWGAGYNDAINIYQMAVNWVPTTPTATITLKANVATAAFNATYDSNWDDVSQPGSSQKLDGIGGILMYRAQWKSWSGYNTIVLNWAVQISSTQRSIKWCELRQDQSTTNWSMYQEGIYTPDAATRWMGSIAMDNNGSIGLSYMKSDATSIFPGIYYSGRKSCDALGTLPITESVVIAGSGSQSGTNRVGDYAHTTLDPDGITFWHTSEYIGSGGAAKTQIFSYQLPSCGNIANVNISQTAGTNPMCPGASATFTATPFNGGTTPAYQWKVNGTNVGTNSTTYTTTSLTNGQIVTCVMTSNLPGVTGNPATSNSITMTVNTVVTPSVSIAVTTGSNPTCTGSAVTFTATPTNGGTTPSYQWKVNGSNVGSNSTTYTTTTLTNGQVVTCVLTSNALCVTSSTATSNSINMTVNPVVNPSVTIAQTAGTNPLCTGASVTFTATVSNGTSPVYQWKVNGSNVGTNSSTYTTTSLTNGQIVTCNVTATSTCSTILLNTLGTGTSTNPVASTSLSSLGNAYPTYYGNGRQQYLIRASELTALGFVAGNINSIGFTITGAAGNPATLNGYTIKIATTAATVLTTTFQAPTFTTVFGPVNYTPTLNSLNTHTFISPFAWNGTSNLLVDICFSNQVTGTAAYLNYQTSSSFVSTTYYQADGSGGAAACTRTTGTTGSMRPNMRFSIGSTTASATSNGLTMTVNSTVAPAVSIALTSGTNPQCSGASATFTATPTNGGTTPSYQWKVNGVNAGTNSATFTTNTLTNGQIVTCVMTSNLACASPANATSSGITMTVNPNVSPLVSIALTSGTNPSCAGTSLTFTATPTNGGASPSYQWKVDGGNVGTNNASFTTTTLTNGQVVSCELTSNANCVSPATATSGNISLTINPVVVPSVSISLTSGTNPQCAGADATFTATPINGGATPSYQWTVDGNNEGINTPIFTSNTLTNGQVVSCVMTSGEDCASPATATATGITMNVNAVISPSVSILLTSGTNPQCPGASSTFTATPVNGGVSPSYQWKIDGGNVGTDDASFTTTTLTNGQVVSCEMTSNADCVTGNPALSNTISIVVNVIPAINSFAPLTGNVGTQVIISGSGFNNVTSVDFNGVASSFVIDNDNQITATVPPGSVDGLIGVTTSCGTQYSSGSFALAGAVTVNVKLFIEGFYLGGGQMTGVLSPTVCDSIFVSLANGVSPYTIQYNAEGTIDVSGEGSFSFPSGVSGNSYYIVVKHRNTLETWSDVAVVFNASMISFDFTTSGSKAFGSNMIEMDGQYAIRSGDVNQDGTIDADDLFSIETSELLFLTGYVPQDLTGDYMVESADYSIVENNLSRVMARP